ncbi:MAG: hypothetical protein JSV88_27745 [Candidatus Aminicenantes bacterium]|nr:MAG: hypothetical protein JSV88_27745 [Candidatus Aminicenantes bacterium]
MKAAKFLKKIDSRVIQTLVMMVIVGFFIYLVYHHFQLFSGYQEIKQGENMRPVERPPWQTPGFFNFTPDEDYENIEKYQLFSFKKKKIPKPRYLADGDSGVPVSDKYRLLGVVKKDRLFLLVRFNADNKIRLVARGMNIDDDFRVEKISLDRVIITNPSGQEHTYKIFKKEYGDTYAGRDTDNTNANTYPKRGLQMMRRYNQIKKHREDERIDEPVKLDVDDEKNLKKKKAGDDEKNRENEGS